MSFYLIAGGLTFIALPLAFIGTMYLGFKAPRIAHNGTPAEHGMDFTAIEIPLDNGMKLAAWKLIASSSPQTPTILILHGWGANMQMMLPLAEPFYKAGVNCLLLDARNHGQSPEDGISSLPQFTADCTAAIDWLKEHEPDQQGALALLGHSVGAGAVLLAASRRGDVDAVISISSFAHPLWLMQRHLQRPLKSLYVLRRFEGLVMFVAQKMIGHRFEDIAPMNAMCQITCPVLLVHGTNDKVVPVADLHAIENNCPDKRPDVLLINGAGHESIDKIKQHERDLVDFLVRQQFLIADSISHGKKS